MSEQTTPSRAEHVHAWYTVPCTTGIKWVCACGAVRFDAATLADGGTDQ